jgi:hypothetical protein
MRKAEAEALAAAAMQNAPRLVGRPNADRNGADLARPPTEELFGGLSDHKSINLYST